VSPRASGAAGQVPTWGVPMTKKRYLMLGMTSTLGLVTMVPASMSFSLKDEFR
jgi:hypothetical protein